MFFWLLLTSFVSKSLQLNFCESSTACPESVVTCECAEAIGFLHWTVLPGSDCSVEYDVTHMPIGVYEELCNNSYQAVLESVETQSGSNFGVFTSSLNVTVRGHLTVTCDSALRHESVELMLASPPLPPTDLQYSFHNITSLILRLEWSPPEDDGGANIITYQVFVNNFLQVTTPDVVTIIELNSTREHLVQVRAGNCAGYSVNLTRITETDSEVNVSESGSSSITDGTDLAKTDSCIWSTSTSVTNSLPSVEPDYLLRLNIAAVISVAIAELVVIVLIFVCGLLIGLLLAKKNKFHSHSTSAPSSPGEPPSTAADQLVPMYEEVLPPATSIPLEENVAYTQAKF